MREAIGLRWASLTARTPGLALLVWSVGLLDDRIPSELFRLLLAECAPGTSFADVEATGMLWTDEGRRDEVVYRHEHYFRTIRQFEVSPVDRERVVTVYVDWLEAAERPARPTCSAGRAACSRCRSRRSSAPKPCSGARCMRRASSTTCGSRGGYALRRST